MVKPSWQRYLLSSLVWLGLPLLVTLTGLLPGRLVSPSTLLLLYLCTVLYTALRADQWAVMSAACASFLLFNYFHTEPRFSLRIDAPDEAVAAAVFLGFALLAGRIALRISRQLERLKLQQAFFIAQAKFNQALQDVREDRAIVQLLDNAFGELFGHTIRFSLRPHPAPAPEQPACELVWTASDGRVPDADRATMLLSLCEQVRISLSRLQAARILKEAERKSDEEKLRSALLASVSHDLKTPLVTMLGAATSLRDLHEDLGPADSAELLDCIISESGRLESYIQNLLDMTRLGHGPLALSRAWVSVEEIWHVVEKRVARLLANHKLRWRQQGDIPVLHVHPALIEQALFNALDNALKAGGIEQEILVEATWRNDTVTLLVCDHGPGLPPSEWEAVFDQFYTFSLGDRYEKGTGLGLSICRSIFRVHGGDARIVPPPAGFSHCLELTLPVTRTSADSGDEQ